MCFAERDTKERKEKGERRGERNRTYIASKNEAKHRVSAKSINCGFYLEL